ncbi:Thiamine-monophosphate kinase [Sinobacterium norvegicum]|uniref:Thiamine-monophosphate kinase n=1 Tax=Sinobacterium norvegicum TaxID=1641715 RepID=A0ABM9AEC3_9GAMM|nr:thiamine-phosphate kinase [Sinobacterium norvegicum]CAH0991554.1 Thiamine-monophosphate kinase [Sinobacterium norvegicum]
MDEFDLIKQYFRRQHSCDGVVVDNGDDCAIVELAASERLVFSIDTMVEGRHFLADMAPQDLGYRALATALSDLAAMGAEPRYFTLALTLPAVDHQWLAGFSQGLFELAEQHDMALLGGDTTRGPLTITIQVHGVITDDAYLSRAGAKVDDIIAVTGSIGDAAAGLQLLLREQEAADAFLLSRFLRPTARVAEGQALLPYSCCGIDISDGLLADLGHLVAASEVAAIVDVNALPTSKALGFIDDVDERQRYQLTGGDDYELCVAIAPDRWSQAKAYFAAQGWPLTAVGRIVAANSQADAISLRGSDSEILAQQTGFKHF